VKLSREVVQLFLDNGPTRVEQIREAMDGLKFLDRMRENRYHKGLPVIAITVKRLTPKEEAQLADKASAVVIKDDNFIPRIRAFLATLSPMESRTIEVEPIAD